YFLVGAYLVKVSFAQSERWSVKAIGLGASVYGVWLIYAAGVENLLLSLLLYIPGLAIFYYSRYQAKRTLN
ncbi:MAG: arginine:ornithine antiporter, partial [Psychrobacter alimentarius]